MRRHLLGIIALLLIVVGVAALLAGGWANGPFSFVPSSCIRVGMVLGTLWLAFPQIMDLTTKVPPWLIGAILLGCITIAIRPQSIALIAPLIGALIVMHLLGTLLRPHPKKRPRRQQDPSQSSSSSSSSS